MADYSTMGELDIGRAIASHYLMVAGATLSDWLSGWSCEALHRPIEEVFDPCSGAGADQLVCPEAIHFILDQAQWLAHLLSSMSPY